MASRAHPHPIATNMASSKSYLPSTEAQLRCANKRRLFRAFKQTDTRFTADWLLNHPSHTFHHRPSIPSTAFDHAIGICATQSTIPPSTGPATDLLLVPVALHQGRLLGYSFGGLLQPPSGQVCPYGGQSHPLFPHYVGRFSYDIAAGDFLAFVHGISRHVTGVIHLRRDDENRERSMFVVPAGDYAYQRLPGKLLSLTTGSERRKSSTPKYQFTVGGATRGGSTDDRAMNDALAKMERLFKGDFCCPKLRRDDMDPTSGEVLCRVTISADSHFDVMGGVSQQRSKEQAMRTYYSYMSRVSGGGSSSKEGL